jgi:L,D-transpeptidase ErfK/SrfK
MSRGSHVVLLLFVVFLLLAALPGPSPVLANKGHFFYPFTKSELLRDHPPVMGNSVTYTVRKEDTLLNIAREFDLGFRELRRLYPDLATWMPSPGMNITIPRMWIPPSPPKNPDKREIVVNLPEMRLYLYNFERELIRSYPVGIGTAENPTPTGSYSIAEKVRDPVWTVPQSLRDKYDIVQIAPGKKNPLGRYWLGLGDTSYGIHGTNFAWSVGRAATHGCLRLYPEDISRIYTLVEPKTRVQIVYEPVKFGVKGGSVRAEVHPDLYNKIDNLAAYAYRLLQKQGLVSRVDMNKLRLALQRKSGRPVSLAPESGSE